MPLGVEHGADRVNLFSFFANRLVRPFSPHTIGSWGVYIPLEQFTETVSFISMYHGNLTILVHPNSARPKIDHLVNGFWIKTILPLDGTTSRSFSRPPLSLILDSRRSTDGYDADSTALTNFYVENSVEHEPLKNEKKCLESRRRIFVFGVVCERFRK